MAAWIVWLIVTGVLVGVELLTLTLDFGLLAIAALVAAGAAAAGLNEPLQLVVFVLATGGLLGLVRPVVRRQTALRPAQRFGVEALIGREALALSEISRTAGLVRIGGEEWTARPYDPDNVIAEGTSVDVLAIEGVTALVHPREEPWNF